MQFERAIQILCDAGVDFVIIGGLAANILGSDRMTYDLDICYSQTAENLARVVKALAPFHPRPRGFPVGLPFIWDEATLRNSTILTLQTEIGEIDLLAEVTGLGGYRDALQNSITVEAFGRQVSSLDLMSLIKTKRATGREKDLLAVPELESLLESGEE